VKKKPNIYIKLKNMCYINLTTQEFVVALSDKYSFIPFEELDNYDIKLGDLLIELSSSEAALVLLENH